VITILALAGCHADLPGSHGKNTPPPDQTGDPGTIPETNPVPAVCDAGDDVWVQRAFPLVLGRKTHGAHEVQIWSKLAAEQGRAAVIRALAKSNEYQAWWKIQLSDMVYASRTGIVDDSSCFETPKRPTHDGDIAAFLRHSSPDGDYGPDFNMADVLIDSLVADDISAVYQANLFAKYNFTDASNIFDPKDIETVVRDYQGDQLLTVYTDRNVSCMTCHNSEYSVTDDPDPALDRAWGRGPHFEQALFGSSFGPPNPDEFYAMSKGWGVTDSTAPLSFSYDNTTFNRHPWGIDGACGTFANKDPKYDYLGADTAFFGNDYGPGGSVFDLERLFDSGVTGLLDHGVSYDESTGSIDPGDAFAYLTGQNFVDQTWKLTFGSRLLLGYGMSRNQAQQQRLQALTDHFVTDGWSLTELLVDLTADPYFNAGTPQTCPSLDYGMDPVVDPYTVLNEGDLANNGVGELVHRQTARTLLRSLYDGLDWGQPSEYFGFNTFNNPEVDLQTALGVFHSDASPGFNGIDFQGALTWESNFYVCKNPNGTGAGYLRDLFDAGRNADATVEDVILALKDRLTSRGVFEDDTERQLVEDLMEMPLDTKLSAVDSVAFDRNFSLMCGALTQSPEFLMTIEPHAIGPIPALNPDEADDCTSFVGWTADAGITADCE